MSDSSDSNPIDSISENNSIELETILDLINTFDNLNITEESNTVNMAVTPNFDTKNLCIVPEFDGNPNKLHRFVKASESLLLHYFDVNNPNNFQNTLLINGILNKLQGKAEEVVAIHGATNSWEEIKNSLILNFGDQRDENCLNQDLVNLRQRPGESPQKFHEKVLTLLNTICNYIDLKCEETERKAKREFFTKQALKTFLAGLRDPLGPMIRAMRPNSLAQALQFIIEEDNIKHYQSPNNFQNLRKPNPQNFSTHQQFYRSQNRPILTQQQYIHPQNSQTNSQNNSNFKYQQFPSVPINLQRNPNFVPQRFPTNSQVFKRSQNYQQNKPTPMSISSSLNSKQRTQRNFQNTSFQNTSQKPDFISEELFNTEHYDNGQENIEFDENIEIDNPEEDFPNYDFPENFQTDAFSEQET